MNGLLSLQPQLGAVTANPNMMAQGANARLQPRPLLQGPTEPYEMAQYAGMVPGLGLLGVGGDIAQYIDKPETRGLLPYALTALGAVPFLGAMMKMAGPMPRYIPRSQAGAIGPVNVGKRTDFLDPIEFEKQAKDKILEESEKLVKKLKEVGITPLNSYGKDNFIPHVYTNQIGGLSSYMDIPGFGQVRFSDHLRSSGLGEERTFPTADDAFNEIIKHRSVLENRKNEINNLRNSIGISDDSFNLQRIKKWIENNPQSGQKKDIGYWKHELDLGPGWFPNKL